jgi:hypothetical protein
MMMKIEMGKKYTSDGKAVRILCTDRPNTSYNVIGMFNTGSIVFFKECGNSEYGNEHNLVEVWEPTEGELCWFWNYKEQSYAYVGKFDKVANDGMFKSSTGVYWLNCSKFIGELPEHLKDL